MEDPLIRFMMCWLSHRDSLLVEEKIRNLRVSPIGAILNQLLYGQFSHSKSQRDSVINYIMSQEERPGTKTFKEEYLKMLADFAVEYDAKYLLEFYD